MPFTYHITLADALSKHSWGTAKWSRRKFPMVSDLSLLAVRNEVTGAQVQVTANEDFVLVTDQSNWLHPLGFTPRLRLEARFPTLPEGAVELFPVGYVEGDDRRMWMEYLDRSGHIEAPAGRVQAVYIRIRVPQELEPGLHDGELRAYSQFGFGDEVMIWQGAVHLTVSPLALPDARDYTFHLNLWQHLTSLARFYRVPLWSDAHFDIIDRYYASIAQLGQKAVSIVATEFPWSGQRCYRDPGYPSYLFEHSMIGVVRADSGSLSFDYTALDRLLALAAVYGIDRQIDVFGLLNIWVDPDYGFGRVIPDAPDAVRVRCYDAASGTFTYLRTAGELREFIRALHDHFVEMGVIERVRVAADEPHDLEAFNRSLAFIKEAGPRFQYTAAINHYEFLEDTPPEVIDFTPILPYACQDPDLTRRLTGQLHERGGKMTWYVCCWPPLPNTFLHSPLMEGRLHGWLNYAMGLDGFLRWAFCLWPADPWKRVSWRAPDWSAGDMYFVLPGMDGAPVETLRYEALRMAVQDYELIKMVERQLPGNQAQEVIGRALGYILRAPVGDFAYVGTAKAETLYSLEPDDYHSARKALIDALVEQGK